MIKLRNFKIDGIEYHFKSYRENLEVWYTSESGESFSEITGELSTLPENKEEAIEFMEDFQWIPGEFLDLMKKEFMNKQFKLVDLDNDVINFIVEKIDVEYTPKSIFEYDTRQMLKDSFCYQYDDSEGYNFEFEIIKNNKSVLDITVKVINIIEI